MMSTVDVVLAAAILRLKCSQLRQRRPEVGAADLEAAKALRCDADDFKRCVMNEHRPSDHVGIALEMAIPSLVTQHDHRIAA